MEFWPQRCHPHESVRLCALRTLAEPEVSRNAEINRCILVRGLPGHDSLQGPAWVPVLYAEIQAPAV